MNNKKIIPLFIFSFLISLIIVCNLSGLGFKYDEIDVFAQNDVDSESGGQDEVNEEGVNYEGVQDEGYKMKK